MKTHIVLAILLFTALPALAQTEAPAQKFEVASPPGGP
jgi:hypothetical protein